MSFLYLWCTERTPPSLPSLGRHLFRCVDCPRDRHLRSLEYQIKAAQLLSSHQPSTMSSSFHNMPSDQQLRKEDDSFGRGRSWYDVLKRLPFKKTRLGSLPGEIRELIYEHVLIVPPWKLPIIVRPPTVQNIELTEEAESLATLSISRKPKPICAAIKQVCRKIHEEAGHIFFAQNSFRCESVHNLRQFLERIGPNGRNGLTVLKADSLLSLEGSWESEESLKRFGEFAGISSVQRQRMASDTSSTLGRDAREVSRLLAECKKPRKFNIDTQNDDDLMLALWLTDIPGWWMLRSTSWTLPIGL